MITVGIYGIADTTHGRRPTYTHDHSIALMRDGRVLTVVQLAGGAIILGGVVVAERARV